jgi:hypothetical protein
MSMMLLALGLASNRVVVGAFRPALPPSRRITKAVGVNTVAYRSHGSFSHGTRRMSSSDSDANGSSSQVPEVDIDVDVEVTDPNDKFAIYRNRNNIRDQVFSAISGDGGIKVTAVTARNLLNDMMMKHTLTEVPTEALGRTMICALLMSNGIQDEQNVQITMQGMNISYSIELVSAVEAVKSCILTLHLFIWLLLYCFSILSL